MFFANAQILLDQDLPMTYITFEGNRKLDDQWKGP